MKRMSTLAHNNHLTPEQRALGENLFQYKEESAREVMENTTILHHHNEEHPPSPGSPPPKQVDKMKKVDDISVDNPSADPPVQELAGVTLGGKGKSV